VTSTCNCCAGIHVETPRTIDNRPGLTAIAYRAGDWASFRRSMLASLTGDTPIAQLTTREEDDFTIALLDAFAVAGDVLTFYQERIANESYLRTARERMSVLELARLIGYELAPGVASAVWLAFDVDQSDGAPKRVLVDAGSRVQSVPGQNEEPQTFETSAPLDARVEWNELKGRTEEKRFPQNSETVAFFRGTDTGLRFGDGLLLSFQTFRRVLEVEPDFERKTTRVTWAEALVGETVSVHVMRVRANLFGHNAPRPAKPDPPWPDDWPFTITNNTLLLDGVREEIRPNTSLVVTAPGETPSFHVVDSVEEMPMAAYSISGKVTRVVLKSGADLSRFDDNYRTVTVFAAPEELPRAGYPLTDLMPKDRVELEAAIPPLEKGRAIVVSGTAGGESFTEVARVASMESGNTVIRLAQPLAHAFERASVRVRANVAEATHGESVREVLGSGDASAAFQRFRLSHAPLTYVQDASAPRGARSTLRIFVNDIEWHEVPSLYAQGPHARVFATRRDDDGRTTILFGDGKTTGARLPTGSNNVRALYRKTMGLAGNVDAGKISLLLSRPLGLSGVSNPTPALGGDRSEVLADARANAPHTVLTLDRVVSLRDYESFAASYRGIVKAVATWTWSGTERQVFLTVAGTNGTAFAADDPTLLSLTNALRSHGHPYIPLRVVSYVPVPFTLAAHVIVEKDRVPELVLESVRAAVAQAFAFEQRAFGEAVDLSDIVKVMHGAGGVVSVDIKVLRRTDDVFPPRNERLTARPPRQLPNGTLIPAEILVLDSADIQEAT